MLNRKNRFENKTEKKEKPVNRPSLYVRILENFLSMLTSLYRAFAHDVTAAMLVFKFKIILIRLFCLEH
jgi:hypothetical protein